MQEDTAPPDRDDVSDSARRNVRDFGPQPIAQLMEARGLKAKDLVGASTEQLTHKMVQRACKGRRLSSHVMAKVRNALNAVADAEFALADLFDYRSSRPRD